MKGNKVKAEVAKNGSQGPNSGGSEGVQIIDIADLLPAKKNARKRTEFNLKVLTEALHEVGAARSGVIDENNNILAGNGTYEALAAAGISRIKVVEGDGNEWIVVRRRGLSKKKKERLAVYDNRSAELAVWDYGVLQEFSMDGILDGMWSGEEIAGISRGWASQADDPQAIAEYDPDTETYTIKIEKVAPKHKDQVLQLTQKAVDKLGYKAAAF